MRRVAVLSVASMLALGACAGGGGGSATTAQPASVGSVAIAPVMLSASVYVAMASSIDLFQVKSAELALQRANDPSNRAFAERALSAHRGTSAQLSMAGRRLNLLPSATLDPGHQAMLDELKAAPDFDRVYRSQQNMVLQEGLSLHEGYAKSGSSPTLRPVAANAENVMRSNLQALRSSR